MAALASLGVATAAFAAPDQTGNALQLVKEISEAKRRAGAGPANPAMARSLEEAEIAIAHDIRSLLSLVNNGFLNYHQTGQSGKVNDQAGRLRVEGQLSGRRFDRAFAAGPENELLPKYGYLLFPGDANISLREYGDVFAILKNDVKKRATWTPRDSLDLNPTRSANELLQSGMVNTFSAFSGEIKPQGRYREAQIWGPVGADQIAEIVIPSKLQSLAEVEPYLPRIIEAVTQKGIPISVYDADDQDTMRAFRQRRRFAAGAYPDFKVVTEAEKTAAYRAQYGEDPPRPLYQDEYEEAAKAQIKKYIEPYLPAKTPCAKSFAKLR